MWVDILLAEDLRGAIGDEDILRDGSFEIKERISVLQGAEDGEDEIGVCWIFLLGVVVLHANLI